MKHAERQMIVSALRAMYQHAEVVSGAYKLRHVQVGVEPKDYEKYIERGLIPRFAVDEAERTRTIAFRDMTDEEKLQDSLDTMQRHIRFVQDCLDAADESEG